jgi:hypothetical protein
MEWNIKAFTRDEIINTINKRKTSYFWSLSRINSRVLLSGNGISD